MRRSVLAALLLLGSFAAGVAQQGQPVGPLGLRSKIVIAIYDLTTASGTQTITGCGFAPTAIVVLASGFNGGQSIGFLDGTPTYTSINRYSDDPNFFPSSAGIINYSNLAGTAKQVATAALASDGATLTWTKTGSPTGTLTEFVLCLR